MIENFLGFGAIALIVLAVVFIIPRWVILATKSENNPDHIYTIFWEEAGYRGHKILSAVGCLFSFITLSSPNHELEGYLLTTALSVGCFIYHSSIYRGYPVFTRSMKFALALFLGLLSWLCILTRIGVFSGEIFAFVLLISGYIWGSYAVYQRAKLIQSERFSKILDCSNCTQITNHTNK